MSDLIDREALLKQIGIDSEDSPGWYRDTWQFMRTIDQMPSVDIPTWIPCSERLPSEKDYIGDVVIWCTDKNMVGVGWYYESTKSWATIDDTFPSILGEVVAWMPLPKPWKGADDEATT